MLHHVIELACKNSRELSLSMSQMKSMATFYVITTGIWLIHSRTDFSLCVVSFVFLMSGSGQGTPTREQCGKQFAVSVVLLPLFLHR